MDIKDKLSPELKKQMTNCSIEIQVLQNLLTERKERMQTLVAAAFKSLGLSPTLYGLEINPSKDEWRAVLRPGQLITPSQGLVETIKNNSPLN